MPRHRAPSRRRPALLAVAVAVALTAAAVVPSWQPAAEPGVLSVRDECATALGYEARTDADVAWLRQCVSALTPPTVAPTGSASATPTAGPTTPAPTPTSTPTPTPVPTTVPPTTTPPPVGSASWPTPETTGATGTLTPYTGSCDLRTANAVYENRIFNCELNIYASGVVIRNSLIRGGPNWGANTRSGGQATFDHVTIQPPSGCHGGSALTGANYIARSVKVLDFGEGFWVTGGGNVNVSDSYARICATPGSGAHSDGIQAYQATGASVVRHNHIDQRPAACCVTAVLFWSDSTADSRVTFVDNLVLGGGYSLRIHSGSGHVVTGNVIDRSWKWGPVLVDCGRVSTWSGNRVASVGADLSLSNVAGVACNGSVT